MRALFAVTCLIAVGISTTTQVQAQAQDAAAIFLNQRGFSPDARKIALVESDSDTPLDWTLYNSRDESVARGKSVPLGYSDRAERALHRIDFSTYQTEGEAYLLGVDTTVSPDFDIANGLYAEVAHEAGRYFYHNRAGEPVLAKHVGDTHARLAGDIAEIVTCFSGQDMWGTTWRGCDYELDVTGGWYDAGDHGKYIVNAGISTWTLLVAYENFSQHCGDGCLNIPESGNGLSDILDEARDNIEWMLSMQIPDGKKVWIASSEQTEGEPLTLSRIDAGGLVHHKVHDKSWAGVVRPDENNEQRYLYPPSTGATLNLAAVAEACARIWATIDADFAQRCDEAADRAFAAAQRHDDILAYSNFDGGGPYGDSWLLDEFYWVARERKRAGKTDYATPQSRHFEATVNKRRVPKFNATETLGVLSGTDMPGLIDLADNLLAETTTEPFHIPFSSDHYSWGSNGDLANRGMVLGHAYLQTGERKYRDAVVDLADYFLGRNPMGVSYITGFGDRPYVNPHHRHWAHSRRSGAPMPPPGVLSGGPNNSDMSDPVAETMVGTCAAQTCWRDDWEAWTQNEVTINWNAPLFWMMLFLDATESQVD